MANENKFRISKNRDEDTIRHAIERMVVILELTLKEDNPYRDIIQGVIKVGEWALEDDGE